MGSVNKGMGSLKGKPHEDPDPPSLLDQTTSKASPTLDKVKGEQHVSHVVTWEGPQDPRNPMNWSNAKKWTNVALISCQATLSPVASTILAVGSLNIAEEFNLTGTYTPTLPVAIFVLGTGLGPLYLAPCSELYGRRAVYIICFAVFTILNIGCALAPNITGLSILRFLSGMAGSAGPGLGGSTIGDMFERTDRGRAQALYSFGPTAGPVIGGAIGGFIVQGTGGWRWLMWIMAIAPGITVVLSFFLLNETYAPILLARKANELRQTTGDKGYRTEFEVESPAKLFTLSITRPLRMLILVPICTAMSLYMSLIYGILYLHLVTIPLLFGPVPAHSLFTYGWQNGITGLAYLGAGVGILVGIVVCAKYLNRSYAYMLARNGQELGTENANHPEFRLPFMQLGMTVAPIGLTLFAWAAQEQLHWAITLLGAAIFSVGMLMTYVSIQTYIVDAFERFAASALAAIIVARAVVSCVFALVGVQVYTALGYAWGTMLLAFICIAMTPVALFLYVCGPRLRRKEFTF